MSITTHATALLACVLITACSSSTDEPKPATNQNQALLKAAQQPLDQARQIEKQLQEADEARRKQLDHSEQ